MSARRREGDVNRAGEASAHVSLGPPDEIAEQHNRRARPARRPPHETPAATVPGRKRRASDDRSIA